MTGTVQLLRLSVAAVLTAALAIGVTAPVAAQTDEEILEEVLAFEQSLTDSWFQNDISAWVASINDETTYFDPAAGQKLTGEEVREFFRTVYEGNIPPFDYEITDPSVVVRDDIVVFTSHMDVIDPATGEQVVRWMQTKVFERTDDGLQTITVHLSQPAPPSEEAPAE